ncbi:myristoyl-CoA:protein N-myristoyltransferase [Nitzschia inconspicua]|uniref:Glycylpeptide N-tetradecanoyltransferase n=1 Tax=Nitzschia inconspicua TaxID=303405 RepID=A0A9K3L1J4_9STRA|nr:myristoyl-CoA:protein N-myristoyltransferase [Nitzschia inconspicua]
MSSSDDDEKKSGAEKILDMLRQAGVSTENLDEKKHAFWDTQPMPHGQQSDLPEGPIVPNKNPDEIRSEPYNMPTGFEWSTLDIMDPVQREELYTLLANNYVEDDDALFRFDYSKEFLEWALTPPGYSTELLLGVRATSSKKLIAFISAVPANVKVQSTSRLDVVEINFLCVHKKLRAKRLAPVLIKEITRRVNQTGVFQAVYTAGVVLPVPVASARYYHRSLNPKKLVRVGFSRLNPRMTMARMQKLYKVPDTPKHDLIPMTEEHVDGVHKLLSAYLESKFLLHVNFSKEDVAHWLLPRTGVVDSYVLVDEQDKTKVTDMVSFYHLPSTILGKDDTLYAAYSYYNVATTMSLLDLMRDALILANSTGTDVFNALNLMENDTYLEELKFGKGDGNLQYYVYNWSCPSMKASDVGIVLL